MTRTLTLSLLAASLLSLIAGSNSWSGESEFSGSLGLESRTFFSSAAQPAQDHDLVLSGFVQPEFRWNSDDRSHRVTFVGFYREDFEDDQRSHGDIRELFWNWDERDWDLTVGINKVFWGVAESRHLVDVINQSNLLEDLDEEDKLGQPMVNLNLYQRWGRVGLFVLPGFREREFPGSDGRLRTPLVVDGDAALYESSQGDDQVDYALRYSNYFGDIDLGLSLFEGTSREPRFQLAADAMSLIPVYDQMTQIGIDLQYTADTWLWKLESIHRDTRVDSFYALVAGFERTFYQVGESTTDVGLLIEWLFDDRNAISPATAQDSDLFIGSRLAFNDFNDTAILAGVSIDLNTEELFLNIEAERRFGDSVFASLRLRAFENTAPKSLLSAIDQDDYLQLEVGWYY